MSYVPRMTIFEGLDLRRASVQDALGLMRGALVAYETYFYELMDAPCPLSRDTARMALVDFQSFETEAWRYLYEIAIHYVREELFPFDVLNAAMLAAEEFARANHAPYPVPSGFYRPVYAYRKKVHSWRTSE